MDIEVRVLATLGITLALLIISIALIYSIPIICIRRFHQPNNILTVNICLATILCLLSWFPLSAMIIFDNQNYLFANIVYYATIGQIIFTIQVPFSFVVLFLHRYCSVVYHRKSFFRKKQWSILCIGSQWSLGFLLSIPKLLCWDSSCKDSLWRDIYIFSVTLVFSSIFGFIINLLIIKYVRTSSRRIQPHIILNYSQQTRISRRDIVLFRHILIMLCIFVGGWTPALIVPLIKAYIHVTPIVLRIVILWCELALFLDIIDLYFYNYELRKYLETTCIQVIYH